MQAAQRPTPDVERYAPLRIAGAKAALLERVAAEDAGKKTSFIRQLFRLDQPNSGDCKGVELHGKTADGCFLGEIRCKIPELREFSQRVSLPGRGRKPIGRAQREGWNRIGPNGIKSLYSPTSSGYVSGQETPAFVAGTEGRPLRK